MRGGHLPVPGWVSGGGDGRGSSFPQASILLDLFDGRERSGEARGSRMMGGKHKFPRMQLPGAVRSIGNIPDHTKRPIPKRDWVWEPSPAIAEA